MMGNKSVSTINKTQKLSITKTIYIIHSFSMFNIHYKQCQSYDDLHQ